MIYIKFLLSLLKHKHYVYKAGRLLKVPWRRLLIHDWSKFTPSEFVHYARNFHGDYADSPNKQRRVSARFTLAWLHHENHSPHHWGYWVPRSGKHANEPLPMPEVYVREMIADFMGASKAYTDSWNITAWLNEHGPKMRFHGTTKAHITKVMTELGYFRAGACFWSWRTSDE